jgi:uncharacterized protein YndB with AHSA1/START domain
MSPVGRTRDAGWELGVRRTTAASLDRTWAHLLGAGLATWLGDTTLDLARGAPYTTADGTTGEVRGYADRRRLRLTWLPPGDDHESTVQVTVQPTATGTAVSLLQERMRGPEERERRLGYWTGIVERLVRDLDGEAGHEG